MAISDLKVYNEYLYEAIGESVAQEYDKFNAASNGALVLMSGMNQGDFQYRAQFKRLSSALYDRDPYNVAAITPENLAQREEVKVKKGRGFAVQFDTGLNWIRKNESEAIMEISRQFAEDMVKDQLNIGISALVAGLSANTGVKNDVSATAGVSQTAINDTLALFGDMSSSIVALVMNGATYHKLIGEAITNSNSLYTIGGVAVVDGTAFGQGRPIIVTDAPALYATGTPNLYKVLGLTAGGLLIEANDDLKSIIDEKSGNSEIQTVWQATWSYNIGLRGYSWDVANGGKAPTDAEIATGTNWDKTASSDKTTAGVILIGDASK